MRNPTKSDSPSKTCTANECTRPLRARGFCGSHYNAAHYPNRHAKRLTPCAWCGTEVMKNSGGSKARRPVCSDQCRQWLTTPYCPLPADHWARWYGKTSTWTPPKITMSVAERGRSQRSPLRAAIEDGIGVLAAIKAEVVINDNGCWIWQRQDRDGYPAYAMTLKTGKVKQYRMHRVSLEAKLGKPLGKQAAHHMCATSMCVNPDHLQPISFRENTAEMMQRNYYVTRIRDLEAALMAAAPTHPLLREVGLPIEG